MFKTTLRFAASITVALASLAACDAAPVAPVAPVTVVATTSASGNAANTYRIDATVPHSFVQYSGCANAGVGELLQVAGQLAFSGHWVTNSKGQRQHAITHANFSGVGTGWDTGDTYDFVTREFSQVNTNYGADGIQDSGEELDRIRLYATNRATRAGFEIQLIGRFLQTPTGEFKFDGWTGSERCK